MGSRLRPVPERILECLIEVSAPSSDNKGATLLRYYPESYEDVDVLQDVVTKFCFPFEQDAEMVDAVQHFTFVLTDIDGLYRFGFCRYPPKAKTCLCILSDLPAFDMFYCMLNTIAELDNNPKNESLTSKQFLDLVLKTDVPEPGSSLLIKVPGGTVLKKEYYYPDPASLPSIPENRNLTDYFSAVNPSNMIALFASMMYERRIIVTSKKLSLLTACSYSASSLLFPMHWQHVFIPVIPPSLLEYCCAPMPFLVGVHSSLMKRVRDMPLNDVVILDVDKNEIEVPCDDVENLPSEAVNKLNNALKKSTIAIGDYVSRAFLDAIVILIGDYRNALKLSGDTIVFKKDIFVNSRPHMKSFLENLLTLQLFERFIHHRLEHFNALEAIDDVFEEQVGLHLDNSSKWATQYKQWVKNRKRDGSQLLSSISGKTEKATYKASKFIQAGFKNMRNHGKYGWKEAVKGLKETKKNFIEYVKKSEGENSDDNELNRPEGLTKANSLPMRKTFAVKGSPMPPRKSLGSALNNRINLADLSSDPTKPPKLPPRVPTRPPPRPPAPFQSPHTSGKNSSPTSDVNSPPSSVLNCSSESDTNSLGKLRPSMCRDPDEPPVKDLINFFDSHEDLTKSNAVDPFADFKEFSYKPNRQTPSNKAPNAERSKTTSNDSTSEEDQSLLWDTMVSLSDDTRRFLRDSRLESENTRVSENPASENGKVESPRFQRKRPVKKKLRELALEHEADEKCLLTHSESCPSLFDPLPGTDSTENELKSSSSSNIEKTYVNGLTSNVDLLADVCESHSRTNCHDPFIELISQRHNLKLETNSLPDPTQRNDHSSWVTSFQ